MNDGLKQRMIGAIVLVALAIVFIPVVLDENQTRPRDFKVEIPEKPVISLAPIDRPKQPSLAVASSNDNQSGPKPDSPSHETGDSKTSKAELFDESGMPMSWTLQLAAFKEQPNAEALRDNLRKSGYNSYLKIDRTRQPVLSRVFVGPELDYARLLELQKKLKKELQLEGIIVRFLP